MKIGFLDYKIFVSPDLNEISANLTGKNEKGVLIINWDDNTEGMTDYLSKIIASAQLQIEQDCLLLTVRENEKFPLFSTILKEHTISKAIIMGLSAQQIGLNIHSPQYQPFLLNNCTFIFTEKLSKIHSSPESKKSLWACIKQTFL